MGGVVGIAKGQGNGVGVVLKGGITGLRRQKRYEPFSGSQKM